MACLLTRSRAEACKDTVAGIKEIYFVDFGLLGVYTVGSSDEITNATSLENITAHKYLVKGNNSFETTVNASRENGTVFYEQVLNITLKKLTKEDNKELKLLAAGRPHIFVVDHNDNVFLMGKDNGADVTAGTVSTGNALGDFNGYNLTFTAMEPSPANFVNVDATSATFPLSELIGLGGTVTIGTPASV
mgnify:FL=1|tara:strand:+ start:62 stop:631 length:570 start_codon:yes stop_codon:yes gene_type:complete